MSGTAPPEAIQLRFIRKLQKELAGSTDLLEYAVSKQWVAALQQFVEADETSGYTIPPLSASDWDDNNMYVGEKTWTVLASWYGMESGYPFRRRYTMSGYINISHPANGNDSLSSSGNHVLADNKLDFLTVHCCLLKDLSACMKQPYINIYFWESLDFIEFQLRCVLKVHPARKVRMWLSLSDDGVDMLLENLHLYDRSNASVGTVLCQKYPEILSVLQRRQTAPTPCQPHVVTGVTPVKEDLSTAFVANDWQLTLCLEILLPTFGVPSSIGVAHSITCEVPKTFLNLPLDNIFQAEAQNPDWDGDIKHLLDNSVSEFNKLMVDQRDKLQERTEQLLSTARENYLTQERQVKIKMEEVTMQENRLVTREKELNERDHELNSKLAKFKSMLTEFLTSKSKFEKEAARLAEQNAVTASKVELNVGGVRYITSVPTLLKEEGSTLQLMFSGQHTLTSDKDGSYFIDRDGTHFRHILNFLRDGPASLQHLLPSDMRLLSELRTEAEYYQLHRMAEALKVKMSEGGRGDFVSLPS